MYFNFITVFCPMFNRKNQISIRVERENVQKSYFKVKCAKMCKNRIINLAYD